MCDLFDLIKGQFEGLYPEWRSGLKPWGQPTLWFTNRHFNNLRFYVSVWDTEVKIAYSVRDQIVLNASSPTFFDDLSYEIDNLRAKGLLEGNHKMLLNVNGSEVDFG